MGKQLSESEECFHALVTATSDVIYKMSPDWRTMRQLKVGGLVVDDGEPIEDWMDKYVYYEDVKIVQAAIDEAIRSKSMFELEHRLLLDDGTIGWTFARAVPICNGNGEIIEWFGAADNITQRKRMEHDLQESKDNAEQQKRLYEAVTSNTPDLIYVFDLDYRFSYANDALLKMWGKTAEEAIGKSLFENGYEPWHAEMHEREIDLVVKTRKPIRGEVAFPHAILGRRVYDYIFSPVINEDGVVEAVAGTTRDISEIKKENQRKNEFISMVSHELKTPLTSALGYIQISKGKLADSPPRDTVNLLERTEKQLRKITRMINGFLNVSRFETGKMQIDFLEFDMTELMKEIELEARDGGTTHQINFTNSGDLKVKGDQDKIGQVIQNFISNALKYSADGTNVNVNCSRLENNIVVSVTDEGIGINEEDLPRLFERFYRSGDKTIENISSFGIGLYLCAEIIKRHKGEIWAENEPKGGSTFYFTIPTT